jgi:hypothetical protein
MNITLKNLSIQKRLSEETLCFTADIMVDGKNIGWVQNRGQGGCNLYHWTNQAAGDALLKYAKETVTKFQFEQLDIILDDIITKIQEEKQYRNWCKKGTYFRFKGDKPDAWQGYKKVIYTPEVKLKLQSKYGDRIEEFLNDRFLTA